MKLVKKYWPSFLFLISFLILLSFVIVNKTLQIDTVIYNFIHTYMINDKSTIFLKIITNCGGVSAILVIAIFLIVILKEKKYKLGVLLNLLLITGMNQLLKNIIRRPRPSTLRLINETGYSFPSGHSMVGLAFYGFLIYIIYKKVNNKYLRNISIILLSFLILLIGFSRIYLGVHYFSDVLGGFLFSLVYLPFFISIFKVRSNNEK